MSSDTSSVIADGLGIADSSNLGSAASGSQDHITNFVTELLTGAVSPNAQTSTHKEPSRKPWADDLNRAWRENEAGDKNYYAGHWSAARTHFDHAHDIVLRTGRQYPRVTDFSALRSLVAHNLALIAFNMGKTEECDRFLVEAYTSALSLSTATRKSELMRWFLLCDYFLLRAYYMRTRGQFAAADYAIQQVPEFKNESYHAFRNLRVLLNSASVRRNLGEFDEARALLCRHANLLTQSQTVVPPGHTETLSLHRILSAHYRGVVEYEAVVFGVTETAQRLDALQKAEQLIQESEAVADEVTNTSERHADEFSLMRLRNRKSLGWIALLRGDMDQAQRYSSQVLQEAMAFGDIRMEVLSTALWGASIVLNPSTHAQLLPIAMHTLDTAHNQSVKLGYWKGQLLTSFYLAQGASAQGNVTESTQWVEGIVHMASSDEGTLAQSAIRQLRQVLNWDAQFEPDSTRLELYSTPQVMARVALTVAASLKGAMHDSGLLAPIRDDIGHSHHDSRKLKTPTSSKPRDSRS